MSYSPFLMAVYTVPFIVPADGNKVLSVSSASSRGYFDFFSWVGMRQVAQQFSPVYSDRYSSFSGSIELLNQSRFNLRRAPFPFGNSTDVPAVNPQTPCDATVDAAQRLDVVL
jgi:hypothetical protein